MAEHRAARRGWFGGRWFGQGRTRALLAALGLLVVPAAMGTMAYWTDTATVDSGSITAGSMDLQLQTPASGSSWVHQGAGTTTTDAVLTISNLTPGESQAFNFAARNVGRPPFTYQATVARGGTWTFVDSAGGGPVTVRFYAGASARASNTSTYPRAGTCTGTAQAAGAVRVGASSATVVPTRPLASGASEQLCVVVAMAADAVTANQGRQGTIQLAFVATQATS
jgi:predicted ribosomally synthesized peptide with SipW-like signal peptide